MLKTKRTYYKPTVNVVEIKTSRVLLLNSAKLGGYSYQVNEGDDGWSD